MKAQRVGEDGQHYPHLKPASVIKISDLQVCEGADDHGAAGSGDGDDRGRQPVADRQRGVDDGQGCVTVSGERAVIVGYTVEDSFLGTIVIKRYLVPRSLKVSN